MTRWVVLILCTLSLFCAGAGADPKHAVVAVIAGDSPSLETLSQEVAKARDKIGLSEDQVGVQRLLTQGWKPANFKGLGIKLSDLPLLAVARTNAHGKIVGLVGYPDFVERNVADPLASADRLLRHWADANGIIAQPPQPLIGATSMSPEPGEPFPIGAEILLTVQAASGGTVQVNSASNRTVTLPELGGGLYQGKYVVSAEEQGDVALMAHFVGSKGETADQPIGVFQAIGWVAPKFLSVSPLGGDVYQIKGTAPPGSLVKAKCHIDMGRFLFIGYTDYDEEWSVPVDRKGEFSFNMDLNQAETRRSGIDLEAQFTAQAENPDKPEQRTEEVSYASTVRMTNYNRYYSSGYGGYGGYGSGYYGYRPGFSFGLGFGSGFGSRNYYGRGYGRGYGRCW